MKLRFSRHAAMVSDPRGCYVTLLGCRGVGFWIGASTESLRLPPNTWVPTHTACLDAFYGNCMFQDMPLWLQTQGVYRGELFLGSRELRTLSVLTMCIGACTCTCTAVGSPFKLGHYFLP